MEADYNVLCHIRLESGHQSTGRTRHYFGTSELPPPRELRIVQYPEDPGYYLLYFNESGEELTDTYHESMTQAMAQAEWEFGIQPGEWHAGEVPGG